MERLRGVVITGMPASGKSIVGDTIRALAEDEGRKEGVTTVVFKDRDFVQRSLLKYNDERAHIRELFIPGEGTRYFLPSEGEVKTTHGSLFISNSRITSFSLDTISALAVGRQEMLNVVVQTAEEIPLCLFFVIEWGTAENIFLPEKRRILTLDSVDLFESLRNRKLFGKPLTEQFAVMEVYADDDVRARRNATREDRLLPKVWQFYEKNGGYMPVDYQEKLIFERIENNGEDISILQKVTEAAYSNIQEQYQRRIERQISMSRERRVYKLMTFVKNV